MSSIHSLSIQTIPHQKQRYDTIGDYIFAGSALEVKVSDLGDWRFAFCCAVHEIIEAGLCAHDGVSEPDISAFDVAYEQARQAGAAAPCGCTPTDDSEPGEDPHAPYRRQHAFADGVERLLANALGVVWEQYGTAVERASERYYAAEESDISDLL